jgi:tetratricopeptide (TPR) repeat protein
MQHFLKRLTGKSTPRPDEPAGRAIDVREYAMQRRSSDAIIETGTVQFNAGRFAEALATVDDALLETPGDSTLSFARGATLFAWGRYLEALKSFKQAAENGLVHFDLDMQLGWTYMRLGRPVDAEPHFRKATSTRPDSGGAWIALANALETSGTLAAEAAQFAEVLARWPDNYDGRMLLAACRAHLGEKEASLAEFQRVIELNPARARAWSNMGVALGWTERYEEGIAALWRAFDIDRDNGSAESLQNLATALREERQLDEALRILETTLIDHPDPSALWLRSVMLLESGQFVEGWQQHEFRWMKQPLASARWTQRRPVWNGQDLRGKTIILHAEQGFGDAIQFIRYARLLKERGARVIFDAFKDFGEVSRDFDDVDEVAQDGAMPRFDYHIPLLSLPRVFNTTLDSIPDHIPYLNVRQERRKRWGERIPRTEKLSVGLVWSGNPKHLRDRLRSIPLASFACLAKIDGVQLYSLQKGADALNQIASSGLEIVDLGREFEDFCDTAGAISHLDLVISVDTSVAHLAGALGKPVWTLVAEPADWRWLMKGETTPWYPTMRLFRQQKRNEWGTVIEEVAQALRRVVAADNLEDWATASVFSHHGAVAKSCASQLRDGCDAHSSLYCRVAETRYGIVQYSPKDRYLAQSLEYYGEYIHAPRQLMARFIRPGAWLLDVAAGIGVDTLFLSECAGMEGHVLAYEPDPYFYQIAANNLRANRVNNATLLHRDIGAGNKSGASGIAVPRDTVDGLRLARLDWVRMNSSRCTDVLRGGEATVWQLRPWLFVAMEGPDQLEACEDAVRDYGYQSRRVKTRLFNVDNYNHRPHDIFEGAFALSLVCIPEEIEADVDLEADIVSPAEPHLS